MNSKQKKDDGSLFRDAMSDVRPLKPDDRVEPVAAKPRPQARQREKDDRRIMETLLTREDDDILLESGEELLFLRPGHQKRLLQRLRRGHYSVADSVDLHHMDVATAKGVLVDFLERSLQRRFGCVRVIHGKGLRSRDLPRLKQMTNRVLRKHPRVIAFASARPVGGGTGATEVLLSVRREPRK
jgi:DNA-nicking Smr family endonuclease